MYFNVRALTIRALILLYTVPKKYQIAYRQINRNKNKSPKTQCFQGLMYCDKPI